VRLALLTNTSWGSQSLLDSASAIRGASLCPRAFRGLSWSLMLG